MHESILAYRRFRYLKVATLVSAAALAAYALHRPYRAAGGDTWLGYLLGCSGAALIGWLMWYGVRKRQYGPGQGLLQEWASAHVYLGAALVVIVTLHTGLQFGVNVHTAAYCLLLLVVGSGMFGVFTYVSLPRRMMANRSGSTIELLMSGIAEIDRESRQVSQPLGDAIVAEVIRSCQETRVGGSLWRQLYGRDPECPTMHALGRVRAMSQGLPGDLAAASDRLLTLQARKVELVGRARRDVQVRAWLQVWLYAHVPLSFALLAALVCHVIAVFFYR